jgi:hypothetical protein
MRPERSWVRFSPVTIHLVCVVLNQHDADQMSDRFRVHLGILALSSPTTASEIGM